MTSLFVPCSECGRLIPTRYDGDDDKTPPYREPCHREKSGDALPPPTSYKPSLVFFYGEGPLYLAVAPEVDSAGQSFSHARTFLNVISRREGYACI